MTIKQTNKCFRYLQTFGFVDMSKGTLSSPGFCKASIVSTSFAYSWKRKNMSYVLRIFLGSVWSQYQSDVFSKKNAGLKSLFTNFTWGDVKGIVSSSNFYFVHHFYRYGRFYYDRGPAVPLPRCFWTISDRAITP